LVGMYVANCVSLGVTHLRFWAGFRSGTPAGAMEHISPNLVLSCMIYVCMVHVTTPSIMAASLVVRIVSVVLTCAAGAGHITVREVGPTRIPIILVSTVRVVWCCVWDGRSVHHIIFGRTQEWLIIVVVVVVRVCC
jgi:hypothetical protein